MTGTDETGAGNPEGPGEIADIVRRVRRLDPAADEAAVRRYFKEIADADDILRRLGVDVSAELAPFSPVWQTERPS